MTEREWDARCPVCGVEHVIVGDFISSSQYADGRLRLSCGKHTAHEVGAAWRAGYTSDDMMSEPEKQDIRDAGRGHLVD